MPGTVSAAFYDRLLAKRENLVDTCERWLDRIPPGRLTPAQEVQYRTFVDDLRGLNEHIRHTRSELDRAGSYSLKGNASGQDAMSYARQWSERVAEKLTRSMGGDGLERRAVVSGSIDIPELIEPEVIPIARPQRLIDLFSNRLGLEGNAFAYYVQSVRTNLATAVADAGTKPTSTLTVAEHQDRCRVVAHLSEPAPIRLWYDHQEFVSWLTNEMVGGVLDGLESQIIAGDGSGENMTGLLHTAGTTAVSFTTDVITTLRSAVTALQVLGEVPTGWALNPADAQAIDLLRWSTAGGFLSEGYATGVQPGNDPSSNNIFGTDVKRVVSNSIPAGTAVLGDFTKLRVYVRQEAHIDVDASGVLFTKNQFIARGEGRFGIGVLRPSAFAVCDLTA